MNCVPGKFCLMGILDGMLDPDLFLGGTKRVLLIPKLRSV